MMERRRPQRLSRLSTALGKTNSDSNLRQANFPKSIFQGDTFTFFVGPKQVRFVVHKAAIESISTPLACMMNGTMKESLDNTARLDDIEPTIFEEFLGYAYNGVCGLKTGIHAHDALAVSSLRFRCHSCGKSPNANEYVSYPFCSTACRTNTGNAMMGCCDAYSDMMCVHPVCHRSVSTTLNGTTSSSVLCGNHNTAKNRANFCDDQSQSLVTIGCTLLKSS